MNIAHFGPKVAKRIWEAKKEGKTEVSLTMEELEAISEKITHLDKTCASYFEMLDEEKKKAVSSALFSP